MFGWFKTPMQKLEAKRLKLESDLAYYKQKHLEFGYKAMDIDMMAEPRRWAMWQSASNQAFNMRKATMDALEKVRKDIINLERATANIVKVA
jgi:hypothetical protein